MDPKRNPDINANTETDLTSQDWDDEIDLRKAVSVAATWWREIVLGAFLAAIMGGVVAVALEAALPRYEASTNVAIIQNNAQSDQTRENHRAMLVELIHHSSVEKRVLERLKSDRLLEDNQYIANELFKAISIELVTAGSLNKQAYSNMLRISAKADSPEKARALAEIWTEEYVIEMNLQNRKIPLILIDKARTETDDIFQSYKDAQDKLELFIRDNKIAHLEYQIYMNKQVVRKLYDIRKKIVISILDGQIDHQIDLLDQYYDTRLRLNELLGIAESLHAQIASGGDTGAASNELAIMLFKIHAYATTGDLPNKLEVGLDNTRTAHANAAGQSADMEAVIAALKDRIDRISRDITHQSDSLSTMLLNTEVVDGEDLPAIQPREEKTQDAPNFPVEGLLQLQSLEDYTYAFDTDEGRLIQHIDILDARIKLLERQLESANFERYNLEQIRNQARSSWEAIMKENERTLLTGTTSRPVLSLMSSATSREESLWPSPTLVATVSGVAGLLVMVLLVFSMNSLGVRPFLKKRGTEHTASARARNS